MILRYGASRGDAALKVKYDSVVTSESAKYDIKGKYSQNVSMVLKWKV